MFFRFLKLTKTNGWTAATQSHLNLHSPKNQNNFWSNNFFPFCLHQMKTQRKTFHVILVILKTGKGKTVTLLKSKKGTLFKNEVMNNGTSFYSHSALTKWVEAGPNLSNHPLDLFTFTIEILNTGRVEFIQKKSPRSFL